MNYPQERQDRLDAALVRMGLVLVVGIFMSMLDSTIVNVALDAIGRDLGARLATLQWVVTGYLLALAVVIPMAGSLVDRIGAKRLFIISTGLFTCGSALCACAWDMSSLIAFRVLHGAGGALMLPIAQTMLARAAGPARMGRAMMVVGVPALLGPVLGPVLGGLVVGNVSWRWIFLINLPVGIASMFLSRRMLPADEEKLTRSRFDALGLVLLGPGVALLLLGLSRAGASGTFTSGDSWGPMAAGAVLSAAYVGHATRRGADALLPLGLFRDRAFASATAVSMVIGISIFGVMLLVPLYYQQVRAEGALAAGLLLAPQGLGTALSMPLAGQITDRLGPRWVVVPGMAIVTLSTIGLAHAGSSTSYWLLATVLLARGVGFGAAMMPAMSGALVNVPASAIGHASSALQVISRFGGALGAALMAVVLARALDGGGAIGPSGLADAFDTAFGWAAGITAAGTVLAFLLPGRAVDRESGDQPSSSPEPAATSPSAPS